jgi:hypothetical protein
VASKNDHALSAADFKRLFGQGGGGPSRPACTCGGPTEWHEHGQECPRWAYTGDYGGLDDWDTVGGFPMNNGR